jgi:hypothetical protein
MQVQQPTTLPDGGRWDAVVGGGSMQGARGKGRRGAVTAFAGFYFSNLSCMCCLWIDDSAGWIACTQKSSHRRTRSLESKEERSSDGDLGQKYRDTCVRYYVAQFLEESRAYLCMTYRWMHSKFVSIVHDSSVPRSVPEKFSRNTGSLDGRSVPCASALLGQIGPSKARLQGRRGRASGSSSRTGTGKMGMLR